MSKDSFASLVALGEQTAKLQQSQQAAMRAMLAAGQDAAAYQKAAAEAAQVGLRAWQDWFALWTPRR